MYRSRPFRGFTWKPKRLHTLMQLLNIPVWSFAPLESVSIELHCLLVQTWLNVLGVIWNSRSHYYFVVVVVFLFNNSVEKNTVHTGIQESCGSEMPPTKEPGKKEKQCCSTMLKKWEVVICVLSFVQPFSFSTWKSLKVSDEVLLLSF